MGKEFLRHMHLLIDSVHKPSNSIKLSELKYEPGHVFDFNRLAELYDPDFLTLEKLGEFRDRLQRARFPEGEFHQLIALHDAEVEMICGFDA